MSKPDARELMEQFEMLATFHQPVEIGMRVERIVPLLRSLGFIPAPSFTPDALAKMLARIKAELNKRWENASASYAESMSENALGAMDAFATAIKLLDESSPAAGHGEGKGFSEIEVDLLERCQQQHNQLDALRAERARLRELAGEAMRLEKAKEAEFASRGNKVTESEFEKMELGINDAAWSLVEAVLSPAPSGEAKPSTPDADQSFAKAVQEGYGDYVKGDVKLAATPDADSLVEKVRELRKRLAYLLRSTIRNDGAFSDFEGRGWDRAINQVSDELDRLFPGAGREGDKP